MGRRLVRGLFRGLNLALGTLEAMLWACVLLAGPAGMDLGLVAGLVFALFCALHALLIRVFRRWWIPLVCEDWKRVLEEPWD